MSGTSTSFARRADPRRWSTLGAAALGGPVGTSPMALAESASGAVEVSVVAEGGEAGEAGLASAASEQNAYPLRLALMDARLRVGAAIYEAGAREAALEHVANPHHVFFDDLESDMAAEGDAGFAEELARAMELMAADAPSAEIAPVFGAMRARLGEAAAGTPPLARLEVAMELLRTATAEYDFAVKDGALEDLEEYQDALGFVETARDLAAGDAASDDPVTRKAGEKAFAAIEATGPAFDGIVPGADALAGEGSLMMGAAARVELAALALR